MSDSEFDDSDYDSFVSALDEEVFESRSVANPSPVARYAEIATQTAQEDDLVTAFAQVSLESPVEHRQPQIPPRTPSPAAQCQPPPHVPQSRPRADQTLYRVESPQKGTIITPHWSVAADVAHSERGTHVVAEVQRQKNHSKSPKVYVVFIGKEPGIYGTWRQCREQTIGVPSVHQGYSSQAEANQAFTCAVQLGWVTRVGEGEPFAAPRAQPLEIDFLNVPESAFDNVLNVGITRKRWYNVYQGRTPGIYRTYLECALNVISVSKESYESFFTLQSARESYLYAIVDERIQVRN